MYSSATVRIHLWISEWSLFLKCRRVNGFFMEGFMRWWEQLGSGHGCSVSLMGIYNCKSGFILLCAASPRLHRSLNPNMSHYPNPRDPLFGSISSVTSELPNLHSWKPCSSFISVVNCELRVSKIMENGVTERNESKPEIAHIRFIGRKIT